MYLLKLFFLTIIFTGSINRNCSAQNNTVKKIEQTGNDVEKVSNTIDKLKQVFRIKKNRKGDSTAAPSPTSASVKTAGTTVTATGSNSVAGTIAPNAKIVDADKLGPYTGGAAIVEKGDATALIDPSGNFIVPFNKYKIDYVNYPSDYPKTGFFIVTQKDGYDRQLMNAKGEIIPASKQKISNANFSVTLENNFIVITTQLPDFNNGYIQKVIYVDEKGNNYPVSGSGDFARLKEGLIPVSQPGKNKKGYKNLKNELVVPYEYDESMPFSEGLAVVGKKDEYGIMKYGYIDMKGKVVIPLSFSHMPYLFNGGRAKILYKKNDGFSYGFINKKGEVVIKPSIEDRKTFGEFHEFVNGISFSNYGVMDTMGHVTPMKEFMKSKGNTNRWAPEQKFPITSSSVIGTYSSGLIFCGNSAGHGFINLNSNKVVDAVFKRPSLVLSSDYRSDFLHFDYASGLAFAATVIGKDGYGSDIIQEGYINLDGVFVILKKKAPEF